MCLKRPISFHCSHLFSRQLVCCVCFKVKYKIFLIPLPLSPSSLSSNTDRVKRNTSGMEAIDLVGKKLTLNLRKPMILEIVENFRQRFYQLMSYMQKDSGPTFDCLSAHSTQIATVHNLNAQNQQRTQRHSRIHSRTN